MSKPLSNTSEPVVLIELIKVVILNVLSMAVAFGFKLSDVQFAAVMAVVNSTLMLVGAVWQRSLVRPTKDGS